MVVNAKKEYIMSDFKVPKNEKRAKAKNERGKGKLAMKNKGLDYTNVEHANQWAKKSDPLLWIKGVERYLAMKERR